MRIPVFIPVIALLASSMTTASDPLSIPATSGLRPRPVLMDFSGSGSISIGKIAITAGTGTLEFQGTRYDVLVYQASPPWVDTHQIDYQAIAANGSDWYELFIRCDGDKLNWIFYESLNGQGGLKGEAPSPRGGSCAPSAHSIPRETRFPPISLSPPPPISDWRISGANLQYEPGVGGHLVSSGQRYEIYPINTVDCTNCGDPGWYELHSLFFDSATPSLCFGIIYLNPTTRRVSVGYSLCFPGLDSPLNGEVHATFHKLVPLRVGDDRWAGHRGQRFQEDTNGPSKFEGRPSRVGAREAAIPVDWPGAECGGQV